MIPCGAMRSLRFLLLLCVVLWPAGRALGAELHAGVRAALAAGLPADGLPVIVLLREDAGMASSSRAGRRAAIAASQQRVLDALPSGSLSLRRRHDNLRSFAGRAGRAALEALAAHPDVERVYLDGRVHANLAEGRVLVGGEPVRIAGFQGAGVTVAVLDTGIDTDHPDLAGDLVAEACYCDDFPGPLGCCPGGQDEQFGAGAAEDDDGHGTAVSGIITADGGAGSVVSRGLARFAGIAAVKVLGAGGGGSFSDIDAGLNWVIDNAATYDIRVVNMSLGDGIEYAGSGGVPCGDSATEDAIVQLTSMGITVVASAGNEAFTNGIGFPACVADALSVGGVYDAALGSVSWCGATCATTLCSDTGIQADDFVCHSNSGALLDVLAPDYKTRTTDLGGSAVIFGGTSASAPYVAAEAALLYEGDPAVTPAQVRALLKAHGPLVTNPANGLQHRRSDVAAALTELIGGPDTDADGVPDDGDGSGTAGDAPCEDGEVVLCDDSCPSVVDPFQADADADGVGDVCDVACSNGLDDDGDGFTDYPADVQCKSADDPKETSNSCGLGPELVLLLPLLGRARRARGRS